MFTASGYAAGKLRWILLGSLPNTTLSIATIETVQDLPSDLSWFGKSLLVRPASNWGEKMTNPVIVIGLDSADPHVIEEWINNGELPVLAGLRDRGTYGRLENFEAFSAETPWTTFATGCAPSTTGYWSPLKFIEGSYDVTTQAAFDYEEFPPFYVNPDLKCAIFDVPQVRIDPRVNGIQISAWGAHSAQVPRESLPTNLYSDIVERYGVHPLLDRDFAVCTDIKTTLSLEDGLLEGIRRRGEICHDLLKQEPWDLFMTVFGEAHSAGHNFWQLSQKDHPLYEQLRPKVDHDPMLTTFQGMDKAIGRILEAAPDDATVIVFSAHGMGANTMDLPSATFLPELMYRYSFPGKTALAAGEYGAPLSDPIVDMDWKFWERHVWNTKSGSLFQKMMRKITPNQLIARLEPYFEDVSGTTDLIPPVTLAERGTSVAFEPATWFTPLWPKMKAFALPSFSEGYVRVNLKGREPDGIVEPDEYDTVCDEIVQKINALTCARTGKKMAREIIRTRQAGNNRDPKLPDADIIVLWQEEYATDVVESKEFGRIGPVPHYRAGSHRHDGFVLAAGAGIPQSWSSDSIGHAMDLPATILQMANVDIPSHIEGHPLELDKAKVARACIAAAT